MVKATYMRRLLRRLRGLSESEVLEALEELEKEGLVKARVTDQGELVWSLTEKGKKERET